MRACHLQFRLVNVSLRYVLYHFTVLFLCILPANFRSRRLGIYKILQTAASPYVGNKLTLTQIRYVKEQIRYLN